MTVDHDQGERKASGLQGALDEIANIWRGFLTNTVGFDQSTLHYREQRIEMTGRIREFIDTLPTSLKNDMSDRAIGNRLDSLMSDLKSNEELKNHPEIREWFSDD